MILCEKCGFDYIEIRLDMLYIYLAKYSLKDLLTFFYTSRIKPYSLNAIYTYPELFSEKDDEEINKKFMDEFLYSCKVAKFLNIPYIIVVPPLKPGKYSATIDGTWNDKKKYCTHIYKTLSDIAKNYNVKLCLELFGAKKSSIRTVEEANEIIKAVNVDNLGFVFDTANLYMCGKLTNFDSMRIVDKEKIYEVHINDFDDVEEENFGVEKRCFCGEGIVNIDNFISILKVIGYDSMISIETFRPEYWVKSTEWVIETAYKTTYELLEKYNCL